MVSSGPDRGHTIRSALDAHIQRLRDGWKVGTERKLVNDMCEVHDCRSAIIRHEYCELALMIGVLVTHIPMTKSGNVQVGSDLLHLDTTVDSACWSVVDLVVCRAVSGLLLLHFPLFSPGKQPTYTAKRLLLVWCTSLGRADDFRG